MKRRKIVAGLVLAVFWLFGGEEVFAGWETGGKAGYDSNVNRAIDGGKSDIFLSGYLSFLKDASGETRTDWTFLSALEGAAYAEVNDLSYASLTLAPGLTFFPYLTWTVNLSPFVQAKGVADSDQSALAFGAKVSLKQRLGKSIYSGQYYVYTDSRANEDVYSYTENTLGIYMGINWTKAFSSEFGYEYSHGDSFRSASASHGSAKGAGEGKGGGKTKGKQHKYSETFGNEVFREKVDRHSFGITAGIEILPSLLSNFSYTYSTMKGDSGTSIDHTGYIGLSYQF